LNGLNGWPWRLAFGNWLFYIDNLFYFGRSVYENAFSIHFHQIKTFTNVKSSFQNIINIKSHQFFASLRRGSLSSVIRIDEVDEKL